jgi:arylsulfatase A-like enzyme
MEWTYTLDASAAGSFKILASSLLVMLNAAALLASVCLVLFSCLFVADKLIKNEKAKTIFRVVFAVIPAFLLTTMILLFIDNITYTLWKVGVVTAHGFGRALYALGFTLLLAYLTIRVIRFTNRFDKNRKAKGRKTQVRGLAAALILLLVFLVVPAVMNINQGSVSEEQAATEANGKRPNIILITVDSLNASAMSVYGYSKETTPFLEQFAESALVGENHFSNAQGTIGSLTSLLTGKYPADTRVLASEDVLRGDDAYQHLPGILKEYGYSTAQLSYSYYADADNLNIQNGFDLANNRSAQMDRVSSVLSKVLPTNNYFFIRDLFTRASERVGHIFFINNMSNPYKQVTESPDKFNDAYKLETALSLLETSKDPMFIHIHWMGTHGPKYYPETQVFSVGHDPKTQGNREEVFYLDSVLEFDQAMDGFIGSLDSSGQLDNTVIIITADHSLRWNVTRLPLIIHFPDSEISGFITSNSENLDVAPTLLDYLSIPKPPWMSGQSLLHPEDPDRPVFLAQIFSSDKDPVTGKITYPESVAPFYQFGKMTVVECDAAYTLNLQTLVLSGGKIRPYIGTCPAEGLDATRALLLIREHLKANGFDITLLNNIVVGQ